jgi:Predicted Permease Membrane Region
MDWLHQMFQKSPEIALFLSLAIGYFIGQINFGKFQLGGVGGSLLAAVVISQAGVTIDNGVKAVMFAVFIYAVGYDSGPGFFNSLNRKTLREIPSEQGAGRGSRGRRAHAVGDHRHRGRRDCASWPVSRGNEDTAVRCRDRLCGDLCVRLARRDPRLREPAAEVYGTRAA